MSDRARLDVSAPVLKAVTGWIGRHRRRAGTRAGQRAATVHTQVTLVLRWLRHRLDLRTLALQARISIATAYRYLHEGLDVIAAHAPDLAQVLAQARRSGVVFLCLDGTLIPQAPRLRRQHPGHLRPHRLSAVGLRGPPRQHLRPDRRPRAGAARELVLPALYPHAVRGLPVLADKGYTGAGAGILMPYKNRSDGRLHVDNRSYNELITALRAPAERANALLFRWRALDRVTVCPQRSGVIAAAVLVLTSLDRGTR